MFTTPAYRIETEHTVLRCFEVRDARALHEVVLANIDHLAPWLEWARDEPLALAAHVEVVRAFRRRFDGDEEFAYAVFAKSGEQLLGSVALHRVPSEPFAMTLGYWFARQDCGRGLATEAAGALVRCAFEVHGVARLEIHCDASNARSRALAERLGFRLDAELRDRGHAPGGARAVHSLLRHEYPEAPAVRVEATAYDALEDVLFESDEPRRASLLAEPRRADSPREPRR